MPSDEEAMADLLQRLQRLDAFMSSARSNRWIGGPLKGGYPQVPGVDALPAATVAFLGQMIRLRNDAGTSHTYVCETVAGVATWVALN